MTNNEGELIKRLLSDMPGWTEYGWIRGINPRTVKALVRRGLVETTISEDGQRSLARFVVSK